MRSPTSRKEEGSSVPILGSKSNSKIMANLSFQENSAPFISKTNKNNKNNSKFPIIALAINNSQRVINNNRNDRIYCLYYIIL